MAPVAPASGIGSPNLPISPNFGMAALPESSSFPIDLRRVADFQFNFIYLKEWSDDFQALYILKLKLGLLSRILSSI